MERLLRERPALRRLDLVLLGVVATLTVATLVLLSDPDLTFVIVDRSLDVAVNSLATLAAASLAALAYARYREAGRTTGLFQCSAFLSMAAISGLTVALQVLKLDARVGVTLAQPEQLPLYLWSLSRIVAAVLLVAGGLVMLSAVRTAPPRISRTLFVPVLGLGVLALGLYPARDLLPPFLDPAGTSQLIGEPRIGGALPGVTPIALLMQGAAVVFFVTGAFVYRRAYVRQGPVLDGYFSVALLIAAFSELHSAFYPGVYSGLVTTGDALWLGFFLVLLMGIDAESRADLRALRRAYAAVDRMRAAEGERAMLEERARLARELHDGLAQDLWFAKLKHDRLTAQLPDEARPLAAEVTRALDAAIAEAKQAVATIRLGTDRELPLRDLLARTVDDFELRSGLRADFTASELPSTLSPRQQAELLRVVQEALTNVHKHADATVVRVRAEAMDGTLVVTVTDNGKGFRPEQASSDGLGLQGMLERARLMGGDLEVRSEPSGGTRVLLQLPLADGAW